MNPFQFIFSRSPLNPLGANVEFMPDVEWRAPLKVLPFVEQIALHFQHGQKFELVDPLLPYADLTYYPRSFLEERFAQSIGFTNRTYSRGGEGYIVVSNGMANLSFYKKILWDSSQESKELGINKFYRKRGDLSLLSIWDLPGDLRKKIQTNFRPQYQARDVVACVLGSQLFVDQSLAEIMIEKMDVQDTYPIILDSICAANATILPYTAPIVSALESLNLQGMQVIDMGASEGVLSIVALFQGAEHVIAFDLHSIAAKAFEKNLQLNGFESDRAYFSKTDINQIQEIQRTVDENAKQDLPRLVISNIGPHGYTGPVALNSMRYAIQDPQVKVIILGGYTMRDHEHLQINPATDFLQQGGFKILCAYDSPLFTGGTTAVIMVRQ